MLELSKPLAFFDLETTGITIASDRIIEISIIKVMPDFSEEVYTRKINPGIPIPPETTAIHGIRDEDVKDCPYFKDLAPEIAKFLEDCDLAGYNSNKFDIPLLVEEFLRIDFDFDLKGRRLVDVQNIFHKMEPRNLSAAYRFYCELELINAHSAEADTRATKEIFFKQIERYKNVSYKEKNGEEHYPMQGGLKEISEFSFKHKNADLAGHVIFNDKGVEVFNFGKHKGKAVEKVFQQEPSYYDWIMKAQFPKHTKKVVTAIKLRGFNKSSVSLKG